jgi:hypothetical protein
MKAYRVGKVIEAGESETYSPQPDFPEVARNVKILG